MECTNESEFKKGYQSHMVNGTDIYIEIAGEYLLLHRSDYSKFDVRSSVVLQLNHV